MAAENIICFGIYILVALIMFGIGISQQKSKTPVGFYTGEKPPTGQELSDVTLWNKKHGAMWIIYGIIIAVSGAAGTLTGLSTMWSMVLFIGGVAAPVVLMICYHHHLVRLYKQ